MLGYQLNSSTEVNGEKIAPAKRRSTCLIPAKGILEISQPGLAVDHHHFQACHFGKVFEVFCSQCLTDRLPTCENPRLESPPRPDDECSCSMNDVPPGRQLAMTFASRTMAAAFQSSNGRTMPAAHTTTVFPGTGMGYSPSSFGKTGGSDSKSYFEGARSMSDAIASSQPMILPE